MYQSPKITIDDKLTIQIYLCFLLEQLGDLTNEQMGIVGPQEGKKPRELLMSKESWYERKLNKQD